MKNIILISLLLFSTVTNAALTKVTSALYAPTIVRADTSTTSFLANSTTTPIFTVEREDTENLFNLSTSEYTCNKTMLVEVSIGFTAAVATGSGAAGNATTVRLTKNGGAEKDIAIFTAASTAASSRTLYGSGVFSCVNGDVMKVTVLTVGDSTWSGAGSPVNTWITYKMLK